MKPQSISARLGRRVKLEAHANGPIVAGLDGYAIVMGTFSTATANRAQELRTGLALDQLTPTGQGIGSEIDVLLRRLAGHRLLEYRIGRPRNSADDLFVIEPQVPDYWPNMPRLGDADTLVLSRFAYLRRRDHEMVLESPRAGALFRLCDPKLASFVATLATPQKISQLRRMDDFPGIEFLALLADCDMVFKIGIASERNLRLMEGDHNLALWDFHDFLFHTRSTEGRHTNPLGGLYPHNGIIPQLPAVRPSWPGETIDLGPFLTSPRETATPIVKLLQDRNSTRIFDEGKPVTLAELSRFLDGSARIVTRPDRGDPNEAPRPYPSAGGSWELELYLAVNNCEGLSPGLYHYDAGAHKLALIAVPAHEIKALLMTAAEAIGETALPQIVITIAARFGRVSWKYSSLAYALMLKDAGVLTQTLYLMAGGMGLGGCAIGIIDIEQFSKMTGIGLHIEGPVAQFALGRGRASGEPETGSG